jgi:hypothetical protein
MNMSKTTKTYGTLYNRKGWIKEVRSVIMNIRKHICLLVCSGKKQSCKVGYFKGYSLLHTQDMQRSNVCFKLYLKKWHIEILLIKYCRNVNRNYIA